MLALVQTGDVFIVAIVLWAAVELWVQVRELGDVARTQDRLSGVVLRGAFGAAFISAILIERRTSFHSPGPEYLHSLIGAAVIIAGSGLRLWSIHTLGAYFRTTVMVRSDQTVVRAGPYRLIRHPSYTAILINLLGVGIGLGNWLAVIPLLGLGAAGLAYRIRVEEQALSTAIGEPYRLYMRETKRLIPFIL